MRDVRQPVRGSVEHMCGAVVELAVLKGVHLFSSPIYVINSGLLVERQRDREADKETERQRDREKFSCRIK